MRTVNNASTYIAIRAKMLILFGSATPRFVSALKLQGSPSEICSREPRGATLAVPEKR